MNKKIMLSIFLIGIYLIITCSKIKCSCFIFYPGYNNKKWFTHPNPTRLFFAPTARMLKKGEGYFSDILIFFPGISYGIYDSITIGGGFSFFPFSDINEQLYYFTPKFGLKIAKNFHFAIGCLLVYWENFVSGSISYLVSTYGSYDSSITIGLGGVYGNGKLSKKPIVMIGAEQRVSRYISLVTENYIAGSGSNLFSGGLRILLSKKTCIDLAIFFSPEVMIFGELDRIPYIDIIIKF